MPILVVIVSCPVHVFPDGVASNPRTNEFAATDVVLNPASQATNRGVVPVQVAVAAYRKNDPLT